MSIPPFRPEVHLKHFYDAITEVANPRRSVLSHEHRAYILDVIARTHGEWDKKVSAHDNSYLGELDIKTKTVVSEFAKKIILGDQQLKKPKREELAEVSRVENQLYHEIDSVKLALNMEPLIRAHHGEVKHVLSGAKGKKFFKDLVKLNDPWCVASLAKLAKDDPPKAEELILEMFGGVTRSARRAVSFKTLVRNCLSHDFQGDVSRIFKKIILDWESPHVEHLLEAVVNLSSDFNPSGITLLFEVMNDLELTHRSFFKIVDIAVLPAIDDDNPSEKMQSVLMVLASELHPSSDAYKYIKIHIEGFEDTDAVDLAAIKDKELYVKRLDRFHRDIELKEVYDHRTDKYVKGFWSDYSLKLRLCSKLMHLEKDRNFIRFALSSLALGEPDITPSSKCFPKASGLMIGYINSCQYFAEHIAKTLTPDHEVTVYAPSCRSRPINPWPAELTPLEGDEKSVKWLQDPCLTALSHAGLEQVLFPRFTHPEDLPSAEFSTARSTRVRHFLSSKSRELGARFAPVKMSVRGRITSRGEQLVLVDQLMQNVESLDRLRCTMTFFEGGNVLVGSDQNGKPYAIVGEDLIEMNRKLLFRDMKHLGVLKEDDDRFKVVGEYVDLRDDFQLSDRDICAFIAKDLGLESAEQVYVVEQPDYHLDMALVIMGNKGGKKTVALNDSKEAARIYQGLLEQDGVHIDAEKIKELEKIARDAERMSIYEEKAEAQLKEQGFEVLRVPGRFKALQEEEGKRPDRVNFFNFVSVTLPPKDPKGFNRNVVIALGCSAQYQARFQEMFEKASDLPLDEIEFIFLDQKESEDLLEGSGGINCMTKVFEGKLK